MASKLKRKAFDLYNAACAALVAAAVALSACVVALDAPRPPFERMLNSTVQIEADGSLCSGVVVLSDGLILTNAHCMSADTRVVSVTTYNGKRYVGTVISHHEPADVAVVVIRAKGLEHTPLDCAVRLREGDDVYAVGHPAGLTWTITRGIVSHLYRDGRWTQVDALIWFGNSGGPLFDAFGRLVGLNNAVAVDHGRVTGHGFALPLRDICTTLRAEGIDLT